jgi:hypothetical protein
VCERTRPRPTCGASILSGGILSYIALTGSRFHRINKTVAFPAVIATSLSPYARGEVDTPLPDRPSAIAAP